MKQGLRIFGMGVFALVALALAGLAALAIFVQLDGPARWLGWALIAAALLAIGTARRISRGAGLGALAVAVAIAATLWQTVRPSDARAWAPDVAHGVTAQVQGDTVTLTNIRDFDWTGPHTATERWISQSYDLTGLQTLDMLTSTWGDPDIAHLLVSFGFDDGRHVVFSVEIRREQGESFSELGGFFRAFELVLIAATEPDIVRLRTNARGERVSLYPIALTAEQRREMFLSYVALAQELEAAPQFYNTLTANCTTTVYGLARRWQPDLPVDWRLVLSGRLPDYLADLGVLDGPRPTADQPEPALITPRARAAPPGADFSTVIRTR
ncbi:MAG: DUF4105 domain-containing protein [Roseivivax sp.]|nr:DUF4105 domain-containing protein [Roseivivax sp.]